MRSVVKVDVPVLHLVLQVDQLRLQGMLNQVHFLGKLFDSFAPVRQALVSLQALHLQRLVDLLELLRIDVLEIGFPLGVVVHLLGYLCFETLDGVALVSLNRGKDLFEAVHFCLNDAIDVFNVLHGGFLHLG